MIKHIFRGLSVFALFALHHSAFAACEYPAKVDVPNGATATEAEMIAGQKEVKRFMAEMDLYLTCLDAEVKGAKVEGEDPAITAQRDEIAVKRHNAAVDNLDGVAADFNAQVRAFKDRDK